MRPDQAFELQLEHERSEHGDNYVETEFILSFIINESTFAMDFGVIHEVVDYFPFTKYPLSKSGHLGVINLRGNIVPIIDPYEIKIPEDNFESYKYVIIEVDNNELVGIIVSQTKKIEIEKKYIEDVIDEAVISFENKPMRYITYEKLLSNFEVLKDVS
jgi:purine-binding chemotaxis protein CheW